MRGAQGLGLLVGQRLPYHVERERGSEHEDPHSGLYIDRLKDMILLWMGDGVSQGHRATEAA